ncbi:MAG: hypothetical protein AAF411_00620 [Myxococcota bacterium]
MSALVGRRQMGLGALVLVLTISCGDDDSGTPDTGVDAGSDAPLDAVGDTSADARDDAGDQALDDAASDMADAGDPTDIFAGLEPTVVASLSAEGEPVAPSRPWSLSGNGQYLFFDTVGALDASDDNDAADVYVYDRLSESVTLLSRTRSGSAAGGFQPETTPDGRMVFFASSSAELLAEGEDTNGETDSFVLDRDADEDGIFDEFDEAGGTTYTRLSLSTEGEEGNGSSENALPSSNGRFAVFLSRATNFVPGVTETVFRVYLRDRDVDGNGIYDEPDGVRTLAVARMMDGSPTPTANRLAIGSTVVSDDGRYVAFIAEDGIVAGDDNEIRDLFVYDRDTDEDGVFDEDGLTNTIRVSVADDGSQATGAGNHVSQFTMSRDGRFLFFGTAAPNLDASDSGDVEDLFIHDRDADEDGVFDEPGAIETRILVRGPEGELLDGYAGDPVVSDDLRFVAFESLATNFEAVDNGVFDVFVLDRDPTGSGTLDTAPEVFQVSLAPDGAALTGFSANPLISADGVVVSFQTDAPAFQAADARQSVWTLNPAR